MASQVIKKAATDITAQVRAVEEAINATLAEIADLQSQMIQAHSAMGVGLASGHAAFKYLAAATQGLVQARAGTANCHMAFKITTRLGPGLQVVDRSEDSESSPKQASRPAKANLHIVV